MITMGTVLAWTVISAMAPFMAAMIVADVENENYWRLRNVMFWAIFDTEEARIAEEHAAGERLRKEICK